MILLTENIWVYQYITVVSVPGSVYASQKPAKIKSNSSVQVLHVQIQVFVSAKPTTNSVRKF